MCPSLCARLRVGAGVFHGWDSGRCSTRGTWCWTWERDNRFLFYFLNLQYSDFLHHCLEFPPESKGMGLCHYTRQPSSHTHTRPNPFSSGKMFYFPIYEDFVVFLIGKAAFFCIAACSFANRLKSVPFPFCKITVPPPAGLGGEISVS